MAGPSVSVIVATTFRESLARTLRSIDTQHGLSGGDEVIVVGQDAAQKALLYQNDWFQNHEVSIHAIHCRAGNDWGNHERNLGMMRASGTHIAFLDDDDIWMPGALAAIKRAVGRYPGRPVMFRMINNDGLTLWHTPEFKVGNVGTPCFVVPNDKLRLGVWPRNQYEGDFEFMRQTLLNYPSNALVWDQSIVCACREYRQPY